MKRLLSLLALGGIITYNAFALDITVTPGSLSDTLKGTSLSGVAELTIRGNLDARDLEALNSLPSDIKVLNLSGTDIEKYTVRGGTLFNRTMLDANSIPDYCFFRSSVSDIELPVGTKSIGAGAFAGSSLKSIFIPEGVESIGDFAFYDCPELVEIVVPMSVTSIGKGAFAGCPKLKYVSLKSQNLPLIPEECFAGDTSLEELSIPGSVATIGKEAFRGTAIKTLELAQVKELAPYALSGMQRLESVTLAPDVTIGEGALMDNVRLLTVSGNPKVLPAYYAANCESLDPTSSLSGASEVGDYAFANSAGSALVLGSDVSSLGKGVFKNMGTLTSIDAKPLNDAIPAVDEDSFEGINPSDINLFVTDNSYDAWKNHPQWGLFNVQSEKMVSGTEDIQGVSAENGIEMNLHGKLLSVVSVEPIAEVAVYSLSGHKLASGNGGNEMTLNLEEIQDNVVVVKVTTTDHSRTLKFMIH